MKAEKLASWRVGDVSLSYWQVGDDVVRCNTDEPQIGADGVPMGARWESSRAHWDLYRDTAYAWLDGSAGS